MEQKEKMAVLERKMSGKDYIDKNLTEQEEYFGRTKK